MNFIDGVVSKGKIVSAISKKAYKINKKALPLLKKYENKKVIVGIRPEDFYLVKDPANHHPGEAFTITVEEIELLGTEILVYSTVGDKKLVAKLKATSGIKVGDKIKLTYDVNRTYCFDPKSTLAIA
ncbi:MAG: TOBE domain-containing protein [Bacilli bacterium]|nr:TOBE domain-containing protein [Bacilli bacterium]